MRTGPTPLLELEHPCPQTNKNRGQVLFLDRASPQATGWAKPSAKDKLALATGQYLVELAEGERQCFHFISSHRVTFRCTSSFATNCAPSCTQAICARATAFPPAVSSPPCSAFTAPRWRMPTPSWNRKV